MKLEPCASCESLVPGDGVCPHCGAAEASVRPSRAARILGLCAVTGGALVFTPGCGYGAPPDYAERDTKVTRSASGSASASAAPSSSVASSAAASAGATGSASAAGSASASSSASAAGSASAATPKK